LRDLYDPIPLSAVYEQSTCHGLQPIVIFT
jgi:hypothetical protein